MSLPQCVPNQVCLSCEVCCRFPDPHSVFRPYFTAEEIQQAIAQGLNPVYFSNLGGCRISLVPSPTGEGFLCPAFDPATSQCRIYEVRPLDCQLYPLMVMWASSPPSPSLDGGENHGEMEVVLGWDTKCPYRPTCSDANGRRSLGDGPSAGTAPPTPEMISHAEHIGMRLEQEEMLQIIAKHPHLISPVQDDVIVLKRLPGLTARVRQGIGTPRRMQTVQGLTPASACALRPLELADRDRFDRALLSLNTALAHHALPPHLVWRKRFQYAWTELEGCLCLFAEYADGIYMPLPPLPALAGGKSSGCPPPTAWAACFAVMQDRNGGSAVSRIENVPEEWTGALQAWGYRVVAKDPDYLYRTTDLVTLAGDRYKSQRAAYNRFMREHRFAIEPYREADREACLALFRKWSAQKQAAGLDEPGRLLLADAEAAHWEALAAPRELGLIGRVLRVDGEVLAYTFGYERSPSVFCVLLEVADRSLPGLAAVIFREFCCEAASRGYPFVNTMDDSGLPSLAQAKQAYHPVRLVPSFIVMAS